MNVSIATVAKDVGTTVTGIQAAITFYTLVMASLMITGGKLGQILGRRWIPGAKTDGSAFLTSAHIDSQSEDNSAAALTRRTG
jgi:MFS family permease